MKLINFCPNVDILWDLNYRYSLLILLYRLKPVLRLILISSSLRKSAPLV